MEKLFGEILIPIFRIVRKLPSLSIMCALIRCSIAWTAFFSPNITIHVNCIYLNILAYIYVHFLRLITHPPTPHNLIPETPNIMFYMEFNHFFGFKIWVNYLNSKFFILYSWKKTWQFGLLTTQELYFYWCNWRNTWYVWNYTWIYTAPIGLGHMSQVWHMSDIWPRPTRAAYFQVSFHICFIIWPYIFYI